MNNPIITASGVIPALSCVKVSTTANTVVVCTTSTDTVFGVTLGADTANGGEVVFQTSDTQLDIVTLRAGGTILAGNELVPGAAGVVVTAPSGQFIAMTAATSGQTLTAYKKKVGSSGVAPAGFYGSNRAGAMIRDAMAGTDSLDVIVIGDSNANFPGSGGYNAAWHRTFNTTLRVPVYATSLICGGMTNTFTVTPVTGTVYNPTGILRDMAGLGIGAGSTANGAVDATTTGTGRMLATSQADSNILALTNYLGMTVVGWDINDETDNTLMFPMGFGGNPVVVESGTTYRGSIGRNSVQVSALKSDETSTATTWGSELVFGTDGIGAGASIAYRIVYGTFAAGIGQFKPRAIFTNNESLIGQDASFTLTNTGTVGYDTKQWLVPAFSAFGTTAGRRIIHCSWDGTPSSGGTGALTTGPFACLWHSIVKPNQKGYAVSCLNAFGGLNTALTISKITGAGKLVDAYLTEIRERQVECGGTGRAMVFMNLGINTAEDAITWTNNSQVLIDLFRTKWVAGGGDVNNISFLFTVTHPVTSSSSPFDSTRTAISNAANAYATTNGNTYNLCVVDIASFYTPVIMTKYNMYDSGGNAHLNTNVTVSGTTITTKEDSYFAITQTMASILLAAV